MREKRDQSLLFSTTNALRPDGDNDNDKIEFTVEEDKLKYYVVM
jgi:hypothetical protein